MRPFYAHPFDDDKLKEECGIFGVIGVADASTFVALGLHALQHRGQEAGGIVSYDPATGFNFRIGDPTDADTQLRRIGRLYRSRRYRALVDQLGHLGAHLWKRRLTVDDPAVAKLDVRDVLPLSGLDVLITPLVAFDESGQRLGMGGGFYDRTLQNWQQYGLHPVGYAHD